MAVIIRDIFQLSNISTFRRIILGYFGGLGVTLRGYHVPVYCFGLCIYFIYVGKTGGVTLDFHILFEFCFQILFID